MSFIFQWFVRTSPPPVIAPPQSLVSKSISYWTGSSFPGQRRERGDRPYRHEPRSAAGRKGFEGGEGPSRTRPLERRGEEGVDKDRKVGEPRPRRGGQEARDPRLLQMGELRAQGGSGDGHPPVHTGHRLHTQAWQVVLSTPVWGHGSPCACVMVCWEGSGQKDTSHRAVYYQPCQCYSS